MQQVVYFFSLIHRARETRVQWGLCKLTFFFLSSPESSPLSFLSFFSCTRAVSATPPSWTKEYLLVLEMMSAGECEIRR